MRLPRRTFLTISAAAALSSAFFAPSCEAATIGGPAFGSWWRACLPSGTRTDQVRAAIAQVIERVDATMSPYRASSELIALNKAPGGRWLGVSSTLEPVLKESLQIAQATCGAFDPTVGPLVHRYGFGPIRDGGASHFTALEVGPQVLRKTTNDTTLDFCGIAKGHALDLMAQAIEALGVDQFLLELGGELLARNRHPEGRPWQVAVDAPDGSHPIVMRLDHGQAIATSGQAFQGGRAGGRPFNHIVDVRTGCPVDNGVWSVSVLAGAAMRADALATALYVMGPDAGLDLARRDDLAVLFQMVPTAGGGCRMSPKFARAVLSPEV
jgi:thiamine biosynthesis lipoprotein